MEEPNDILKGTSVDYEMFCNGVSGMASLFASRERGWREKCASSEAKCEELSNIVKEKEEDNARKDEIITNKDKIINDLENRIKELEARPYCLGDNVANKIINIYEQDRRDATRSVAGTL